MLFCLRTLHSRVECTQKTLFYTDHYAAREEPRRLHAGCGVEGAHSPKRPSLGGHKKPRKSARTSAVEASVAAMSEIHEFNRASHDWDYLARPRRPGLASIKQRKHW